MNKNTCGDFGGVTENGNPCGIKTNSGRCKYHKQEESYNALSDVLGSSLGRSYLARTGGFQYGGDRKLYKEYGYEKDLEFQDFYKKYNRQDIAQTIVDLPAEETWKNKPKIIDGGEDETTEFEKDWEGLKNNLRIWHYFNRADKIAGIGEFGILVLGATDSTDPQSPMSKELDGPESIDYLSVFSQKNVDVQEKVTNPMNPRFGMPETYSVQFAGDDTQDGSNTHTVHWSRVIHIADGLMENEIYGTPRLQGVYNRLEDLQKIVGSSAEAFFREIQPFWHANIDKDMRYDEEEKEELKEEFEKFKLGLDRGMSTKGVDIEKIKAQIQSPAGHFEVLTKLIAADTRIPQRILIGSEAGDLASTQDQANLFSMISNRQQEFAEPQILRATIDRLIKHGALSEPKSDRYEVRWPDLFQLNDLEKSKVANNYAKAAANAADAQSAMNIFELEEIRKLIGLDPREEGEQSSVNKEDLNIEALSEEELEILKGDLEHGDDSADGPDSDENSS